jgi:hypothetical protein
MGALLTDVFVKMIVGTDANLGSVPPNYSYPSPLALGVEVLAFVLLTAVILVVVYKRCLKGFGGIAIRGNDMR